MISYDIRAYLAEHGVALKGSGWGICPLPQHIHKNMTNSFGVFNGKKGQWWKCFGHCNTHGDFIDLVGYINIPGYDKSWEMRKKAMLFVDPGSKKIEYTREVKRVSAHVDEDFIPLTERVRRYLHGRGLSDTTIEKFGIGSCERVEDGRVIKGNDSVVAIPIKMLGCLMGVKLRSIYGKKYFSLTGSQAAIMCYDDILYSPEPIIISKGEICNMALRQEGFLAACITSGENSSTLLSTLKRATALSPKIVVIGDNDETGRRAAADRAKYLCGIVKFPPPEYKDWDGWWLENKEEAVEVTRSWIQ